MNNQKGNISVVVSFIIVFCLIGLAVYALIKTSSINNPNINNNQPVEQQPVVGEVVPTTTVDAQSLKLKDQSNKTNKNMEKTSKNGDTLVMNYTGKLTDGTVFDSNVDPKFGHVQPFTFKLGAGQVIKGWDQGLVGMKVGEKKTLTISPEDGYGSRAVGSIPANSTLIFDVELVGIN